MASPLKPSGFGAPAAQTPTASTQPFFPNAQTPKAEHQPTKTRSGLEQRKSDSSLTVLNVVPPKLSATNSASAAKQAVGQDTVNIFVTMQDQMEAVRGNASYNDQAWQLTTSLAISTAQGISKPVPRFLPLSPASPASCRCEGRQFG
jgi:hypothetical protein